MDGIQNSVKKFKKTYQERGMRTSIFQRMMVTYFLILILSLFLIAYITSHFMEQQVIDQRRATLEREALKVHRLFEQLNEGMISSQHFYDTLNILQQSENINISIIIEETQEIVAIESFGRLPIQTGQPQGGTGNPSRQYFTAEFEGEEGEEYLQMLTVAVPLTDDGITIGEILIYTPIANMQLIIQQMNRIIMATFMGIIIPVSLLLYFFSKRFATPLTQMSNVAKRISEGDFSTHAKVEGNDELTDLAESLNSMAYKVKNLEDVRRDLIANVSHELRTPITTVQNFIQGILDGVIEKEEVESYLGIALDETKRLGKLTNELMELTSFERRIKQIHLERFSMEKLIKEVVMQLHFEMDAKNITFEGDYEKGIKGEIDRIRIKQVLINLLNNAIEHTPEGGKIRIKLQKGEEGFFNVHVMDSGPGIDPEDYPYLYERFYKGDKSRRRSAGFGLGLTISKHIMEAHGGAIDIVNPGNPQRGSLGGAHIILYFREVEEKTDVEEITKAEETTKVEEATERQLAKS